MPLSTQKVLRTGDKLFDVKNNKKVVIHYILDKIDNQLSFESKVGSIKSLQVYDGESIYFLDLKNISLL